MSMLAMFLCALDVALALALVAAEKADDNLRRIKENRWDDDGG